MCICTRICDVYVCRSSHPEGAEVYNSGFTYIGINCFMDGTFNEELPAFAAWYDKETLMASGLHYHGDRGNTRFKFGCVVVLGTFEYFHQHYPAFGCTVLTPGWSMLWGDYSDLWHAVGPGSGFRFSFTLFDHEVCTFGVRAQVILPCHNHDTPQWSCHATIMTHPCLF